MIPDNLREVWELEVQRAELLFLADHGGGYPDVLADLGPPARRVALGRLHFRIAEEYMMPDDQWAYTVPWVRLTNGVAVCLRDGFVSRSARGWRHG